MPINRSAKGVTALVLAGGAIAVGAVSAAGALAAGKAARPASGSTTNRGNPTALPPILAPASRSDLKAVRAAEAIDGQALHYRLSAGAGYDSSVFNVFGIEGQGGS